MNNNPMILGLVLIVGAAMYSRNARATGTGGTRYVPPGTGSLPGSAGSGVSQVVGGLVGSLFNMFKNSTSVPPTFTVYDPTRPSEGVPYDPADPGTYVPLQDLVNGSVHDYMTGDRSSWDIPTTSDIFKDATEDYYKGGYDGVDTVIRNPGAYW